MHILKNKIIDQDHYHGIKICVNNTSKCTKIRVNRREKFIEFNYHFMRKLKESQQVFLFEWARFNLRYRDIYKCDKLAFERVKKLGYDGNDILDLIKRVQFSNNYVRQKRMYYLITEDVFDFKVKEFLKKINPFSWFRKKK